MMSGAGRFFDLLGEIFGFKSLFDIGLRGVPNPVPLGGMTFAFFRKMLVVNHTHQPLRSV